MDILGCTQALHSRSRCPMHCWRNSWCRSSWRSRLGLICPGPSWGCCPSPQPRDFESNWLFQNLVRRIGRSPFGWWCVGCWSVSSPPLLPTPPWWLHHLGAWTAPPANILLACSLQSSSTNSQVLDPESFKFEISKLWDLVSAYNVACYARIIR